ncbi:hypothetical protein HOLleu_02353 [Holothuria leucospilota]|uniref:Uncharacterized protein n=1 Tax=Holothuria leucospilota TaxID=206669 RepID=A0A9Q1CR70_HOLLE|nr:hypothetical protein HOLleu_02353 [Holothuria leucospilota]
MKGFLYSSLEKNKDDEDDSQPAVSQIIKRCSDYLCISTKWLKFLEIKNYLAPHSKKCWVKKVGQNSDCSTWAVLEPTQWWGQNSNRIGQENKGKTIHTPPNQTENYVHYNNRTTHTLTTTQIPHRPTSPRPH